MMAYLKGVASADNKTQRVEAVDWTLMDKKGKKQLRVQAPAATYYPEANRIVFEGKVVATRYFAADKLTFNQLSYEGNIKQFIGTKGVRWERGPIVVTSDKMNCPENLERIHLEGNVKGRGMIEEGNKP